LVPTIIGASSKLTFADFFRRDGWGDPSSEVSLAARKLDGRLPLGRRRAGEPSRGDGDCFIADLAGESERGGGWCFSSWGDERGGLAEK
jgi:hypothetical protein